ncbi:hypothetical protein ACL03H_15930 [Saccharopolyspora sp. MS10]|uniref:hypothetical protein n=1 Tax=Saccharopolyspora sp. MS10 TaxID=3385973 RepID=UPI00399F94FF
MTEQEAEPAAARAIDVLGEDLALLTGHRPHRRRLVPGRAHVHRIALTWSGPEAEICLQVLVQRGGTGPGWTDAEARAVAEAWDLKSRGEHRSDQERAREPHYHLVLVDPRADPAVLARRCAALEAGFLDGAGWMRLHSGGRFGEGTFTRVLDRVRADVRARIGPAPGPGTPPRRHGGLC